MKIIRSLSLAIALFTALQAFSQTYVTQAKLKGNKNWNYINQKGEPLFAEAYPKCYPFSEEGFALIYNALFDQYYFINRKGEKLKTELLGFFPKENVGYNFNTAGFIDGMCLIKYGGKWGYLDTNGRLAIRAKYERASFFNHGLATAKMGSRLFVINKSGDELAIAPAAKIIFGFSEGLAPFRSFDKLFGFINESGNVEIPPRFENVGFFCNGLAWAKTNNGKLGYINTKGEWVIEPQFKAGREFDKISGIARVKIKNRWVYVDRNGNLKILNEGTVLSDFSDGLAQGSRNEKFGFYDALGAWKIEPQFEAVRDFKNGYAAAKKESKWGIIDTQGNWVIQPNYEAIKDMELVK